MINPKKYLSTTALSKKLGMTSRELFAEFEKREWITADRTLTVDGFSLGAIYKEIIKDGETIKYIAWPSDLNLDIDPQDTTLMTTTTLGKHFDISAQKLYFILSEIGWAKKGDLNKGWVATLQGLSLGALQEEDPKSGIPFIRWPEAIMDNKILLSSISDIKGTPPPNITKLDTETMEFRNKFPAKYRATDGHLTRSKAEMLIDNWLYMFEVMHAYERKLPIEENVYSNFYIPTGKVYIEYWGYENDKKYLRRKEEKQTIYKKYNLNLIELEDKDVQNLDDVLPKLLLKYGVQTY